jgi:hypothetical protein
VINEVLTPLANAVHSQQTVSLGIRWDVAGKFTLKGQFDHIRLDRGSLGLLTNRQADFSPGSNLNVVSLAVDYLF